MSGVKTDIDALAKGVAYLLSEVGKKGPKPSGYSVKRDEGGKRKALVIKFDDGSEREMSEQ